MIPPSAGKFMLLVFACAFALVGTLFLGLALFTLLQVELSVAAAASVTALILLLPPALWAFVRIMWPPPPPPKKATTPEAAALGVLAGLAREKPLLAVVGAGLLGAAQVFLRRRS